MHKIILLSLFIFQSLFAYEFKVSSYNVENLFDLRHDKTEYKEYIPHQQSQWNQKTYHIKLSNTAKVIEALQSDIIALQEIESLKALNDLKKHLPQYPYSSFIKNKTASIGLAVLSKYPILQTKKIVINSKVNRPIQKVIVDIQGKPFILFNNHWASKRQKESQRIKFAMKLQEYLKTINSSTDYILVGDFNSNYNEQETIRYEKRLNDSHSLTGINHVLNTYVNKTYIDKSNIFKHRQKVHYNLWFEFSHPQRFSSIFRGHNVTPDNIILPKGLFDKQNFSYLPNSFEVFRPNYLYQNKKVHRWVVKKGVHKAKGYSDHLPISASFTTKQIQHKGVNVSNIDDLYNINHLSKPLTVKDVTVIYKHQNHAIIKKSNSRAIFLYNCGKNLKEGFTYDLKLKVLKEYQGLKEITSIGIIKQKAYKPEYKKLYIANPTNLNNLQYQNEMLTQISGLYKKGYLYTRSAKIKLYAKEKSLLPKNGQKITIISGHLGYYGNKAQIVIYKKSDIKVEP